MSAQNALPGKPVLIALIILVLHVPAVQLVAQSVTITGKILSQTSRTPLPASVQIAGTGVTANEKGEYSIKVPAADSAHLLFSMMGYKNLTVHLALENKTTVVQDVLLVEEDNYLPGATIAESKIPEPGTQGQSTESITQQQIDRQAGTSLKAGLQMATGVTILDNQINIRGSSGYNYGTGSRVLVLLDGMPAMNTARATVNFNLLPTDNIEQVEIIKGCGALRYGSGALGGVVNVIMDKPADTARTSLRFAQRFFLPPGKDVHWDGTKDSYVTSLHFSHSQRIMNKWDFTTQVDIVRDAGYRNQEYNNRSRLLLLNEWRDVFKKPGFTLGFDFQFLGERSAVFVFWKNYPEYTHQPGLNSLSTQTLNYLVADPSLKYISGKGNVYQYQSRFTWHQTKSSTDLSGYTLQSWNEVTWERRFKPWVSIIGGGNYQYGYSKPSNNLQGEASSHQAAVFAIGTFRFFKSKFDAAEYRLTITAGARFQYEKMFGDTLQTDAAVQRVALTTMNHPLAGVTFNYQLFRFTRVRASISQGVRAASLNERFSNISIGGLRTNPAPGINPETGYSAEVGIIQYFGYKNEKSTFSGYVDVAGFIMRFDDMIEFLIDIPKSSLTQLSFKAQNLTNVSISGIEINFGLKFERNKFSLAYSDGITLIQPVNHDGLKELDGDSATVLVLNPPVGMNDPDFYKYIRDIPYTLKYRSKTTITQSLTIGWGIASFTTNYRYLSRMINVDKLLLFAIPGSYAFRNAHPNGWHLIDFMLSFDIKKRHTVSAHLFNALNSQYMILPGNIGEQRSVAVQYKVIF